MLINQTTPTICSLPTGVHSGRHLCMYEYLCIRNLDDITGFCHLFKSQVCLFDRNELSYSL